MGIGVCACGRNRSLLAALLKAAEADRRHFMDRHRILVATGDSSLFMRVCEVLERAGYDVVGPVQSYEPIIGAANRHTCSAVIVCNDLEWMDGFARYAEINELPRVFLDPVHPSWNQGQSRMLRAKNDQELVALLAECFGPASE